MDANKWNVRSTNSTHTRELWHHVASFSAAFTGGRVSMAHTVCGQTYDFPSPTTVFSQQLGDDKNLCQKGCYDGN